MRCWIVLRFTLLLTLTAACAGGGLTGSGDTTADRLSGTWRFEATFDVSRSRPPVGALHCTIRDARLRLEGVVFNETGFLSGSWDYRTHLSSGTFACDGAAQLEYPLDLVIGSANSSYALDWALGFDLSSPIGSLRVECRTSAPLILGETRVLEAQALVYDPASLSPRVAAGTGTCNATR